MDKCFLCVSGIFLVGVTKYSSLPDLCHFGVGVCILATRYVGYCCKYAALLVKWRVNKEIRNVQMIHEALLTANSKRYVEKLS